MNPARALSACLLLVGLGGLRAQTEIWTGGGGDDHFGTGLNWQDGSAPGVGSGIILRFDGSTRPTPYNNYTVGDDFGEWWLNSSAGADFVIGGNTFGLHAKIENQVGSGRTLTLNNDGIVARNNIEINPVGGNIIVGAGVFLDNNRSLNVYDGSNGNTLTLNGVLDNGNGVGGNGSLVLNQTATVILAGANDYGTTTLNPGTTLQVGAGGTSGTLGQGNVTNNGLLRFNRTDSLTVGNAISGTGALQQNGSGTTILTADHSYTGSNTINAGTLQIGDGGTTGNLGSGGGNVTNNGTLAFNRSNTYTLNNTVSGTGGLAQIGSGVLVVTGNNSFTGATSVSAGVLIAQHNNALGTTAGGVTVSSGAALQLENNISIGAEALSLNGTGVSGNGALRNFSGNNTYGGTITLAGASEIQSDSGTLTLNAANALTGSGMNTTFDGSGNTTVSGTITTGAGTITKNGSGTLLLSGNNTYTGAVVVNAGVLNIQHANALGSAAGGVTVASGAALEVQGGITIGGAESLSLAGEGISLGGALRSVSGNNTVNGAITLTGTTRIRVDAGALFIGTVSGAGQNLVLDSLANLNAGSAITTGSGHVTKYGSGNVSMTAANTYTGDTFINDGTLAFSGAGNSDSSILRLGDPLSAAPATLSIQSGASLASPLVVRTGLSGFSRTLTGGIGGTLTGSVYLDAPLTVSSTGTGSFTLSGAEIDIKGNILTLDPSSSSFFLSAPILHSTGAGGVVKNGAGTATLSAGNTYTGDTEINNGTLAFTPTGSANNSTLRLGATSGSTVATLALDSTTGGVTLASDLVARPGSSGARILTSNATSGTSTLSGNLYLDANLNVTSTTGGTVALTGGTLDLKGNTLSFFGGGNHHINGVLQNSSGSGGIIHQGTGVLTLAGSHSYVGPTLVQGGVLSVDTLANGGANSGLGAASSGTANLGLSNATLRYTGASVSTDRSFALSTGTSTLQVVDAGANLTFSGIHTGASSTALTKLGAGTLTLAGSTSNSHSGTTLVSEGVLALGKTGAVALDSASIVVGDGTGTDMLRITGSGGDQITNTSDLRFNAGGVFQLNGNVESLDGLFSLTSGAGIIENSHAATGSTLTAGIVGTSSDFSGVLQDGGAAALALTKAGSGTLTLSGSTANTASGTFTVQAGVLLLNKSVANGGIGSTLITIGDGSGTDTLRLAAAEQINDSAALTLRNNAVFHLNGNSETVGDLRSFAVGNGTVENNAAGTATLTLASGSGTATYSGILRNGATGVLALTKSGAGTQILAGTAANTFTGQTAVNGGLLDLNKSAGVNALAGDGNTGTFDAVIGGGTLRWLADNQMADDASLSMTSGALSLNGRTETIYGFTNSGGLFTTGVNGHLTGTGATITWSGGTNTINDGGLVQDAHLEIIGGVNTVEGGTTGGVLQLDASGAGLEMTGSTLTLNSDNAVAGKLLLKGDVSTGASATSAQIVSGLALANPGQIDLDGGTRTFTVADGAASEDLILSARITNGSLLKAGDGTMSLAGGIANTFTGQTAVNDGILDLNKSAGVNAVAGDGNTGTFDVVIGGGTLRWQANDQLADDASLSLTSGALSLNGRSETLYGFTNSGGTFTTGVNGHLTGTGATITWSGGTNTINDGGLVQDAHIVITGGVNTVEGGASGGVLQLDASGAGLEMTGSTLTLNSDNAVAGKLLLKGDVSTAASATSAQIVSGLALANHGNVDLDGGTRTFTVADGAAADDLIIGARIVNGGLTKAGAGTLSLSAANTYAGLTTVSAGTLAYGASDVIGSGAVTVNGAGATLALGANQSDTVGTVTLAGGGFITGSGTSTLTSTTSFEMQSGEVTAILGGTGIPLNKTTSGTVVLHGANTYTGATSVDAGVLNLRHGDALGSTAGATSVAAGAALELQGGIAIGAEALNLAGTGISSGGALRSVSGNNSYSGAITLSAATRIASDSGILTLDSATAITGSGFGLTFAGAGDLAVSSVIGTGSGTLTKDGTGTLVLSGSAANTYTGLTTINAGTVELAKTGTTALGTGDVTVGDGTGTDILRLTGTGGDQIPNSTDVYFNAGGVMQLNGNSESFGRLSSLTPGAGLIENSHASAPAVLNANSDNTSSTFSGVLQDGGTGTLGLLKTNSGTLTLAGPVANTFTGPVTINAGTLALGKSVANGALSTTSILVGDGSGTDTLRLDASNQIHDGALLSLRNGGVFRLNSFSETVGALASFAAGNGTVQNNVSGTSTLTLAATSGSATYSGVLENGASGVLALSKTGAGTQVLAGTVANTFTGQTSVNGGILDLNKTAGVNAVAGDGNTGTFDVVIGGGTLRWQADNQIADDASLSLTSGALSLNGRTETIYGFTNSGGTFTTGVNGHLTGTGATITWSGGTNTINDGGLVQDAHIVITGGVNMVEGGASGGVLQLDASGAGLEMTGSTLTLNSDNAVAGKLLLKGDVSTAASATSAQIVNGLALANPGNVDLDGGTRTFTVADGAAADDLIIGARVEDGALSKAGAGRLVLSGDNIFAGATSVNDGALNIRSATALGATVGATTVASGAALEIEGGISVGAEALSLSGTGLAGTGALRNISGQNTYAGAVTLGAASRIQSDAGTLTLNSGSPLSSANHALTVAGAGHVTLDSALSLGSGALTKEGAGTFTLSAVNTVAGATSVNGGILRITGETRVTAPMTVAAGAAVDFSSGTLAVDNLSVDAAATLAWVNGRLTHATTVGTDGTPAQDASSPGYQFVMPGKTAQITGNVATDSGSILQFHGSPTLYGDIVNGVRFNNFNITGDFDGGNGLVLEFDLNPFLLRPISPMGRLVQEWGSIPLVQVSGTLTPGSLTVLGIWDRDSAGAFTQSAFPITTGGRGSDLDPGTWYVNYDEDEQVIFLHYKVVGYIPEPGSFGLLAAGAFGLRLLRRIARQRRRMQSPPDSAATPESVLC